MPKIKIGSAVREKMGLIPEPQVTNPLGSSPVETIGMQKVGSQWRTVHMKFEAGELKDMSVSELGPRGIAVERMRLKMHELTLKD